MLIATHLVVVLEVMGAAIFKQASGSIYKMGSGLNLVQLFSKRISVD